MNMSVAIDKLFSCKDVSATSCAAEAASDAAYTAYEIYANDEYCNVAWSAARNAYEADTDMNWENAVANLRYHLTK